MTLLPLGKEDRVKAQVVAHNPCQSDLVPWSNKQPICWRPTDVAACTPWQSDRDFWPNTWPGFHTHDQPTQGLLSVLPQPENTFDPSLYQGNYCIDLVTWSRQFWWWCCRYCCSTHSSWRSHFLIDPWPDFASLTQHISMTPMMTDQRWCSSACLDYLAYVMPLWLDLSIPMTRVNRFRLMPTTGLFDSIPSGIFDLWLNKIVVAYPTWPKITCLSYPTMDDLKWTVIAGGPCHKILWLHDLDQQSPLLDLLPAVLEGRFQSPLPEAAIFGLSRLQHVALCAHIVPLQPGMTLWPHDLIMTTTPQPTITSYSPSHIFGLWANDDPGHIVFDHYPCHISRAKWPYETPLRTNQWSNSTFDPMTWPGLLTPFSTLAHSTYIGRFNCIFIICDFVLTLTLTLTCCLRPTPAASMPQPLVVSFSVLTSWTLAVPRLCLDNLTKSRPN